MMTSLSHSVWATVRERYFIWVAIQRLRFSELHIFAAKADMEND